MDSTLGWILVLGAAAGAAALVALVWLGSSLRHRRSGPPPPVFDLDIDPADRAELERTARDVLAEHLAVRHAALLRHVRLIVGRGVPARSIQATDVQGQWYLVFADGTEMIVRSRHPGEVAELGMHLATGRVNLTGCAIEDGDLVLEFVAGRRRLRVLAVADA